MYENTYRDYLDNKRFYQQHLQEHGRPQYSDEYGGFGPFLAVAGILGGGFIAYERGLLKNAASEMIKMLAKFQPAKVHALTKSIRDVAGHDIWHRRGTWLGRAMDVAKEAPEIFNKNAADAELRLAGLRARNHNPLTDNKDEHMEMELIKNITSRGKVQQEIRNGKQRGEFGSDLDEEKMDRIMIQKLHDAHLINEREQAEHLRRTGHRYASVADVWDHITSQQRGMINEAARKARDYGIIKDAKLSDIYKMWHVDKHILADEHKGISDLREFRHAFGSFMDSFSNEFGIPLVHFNPAKLFWLDRMTTMRKPPMFSLISANTKQPIITGHNGYLRKGLLFANGDVHDLSTKGMDKIAENMYLVSGKTGPVARLLRTMSQIPIKTFQRPTKGFFKKLRYDAANLIGWGMQDEPIHRYTDDVGVMRNFDFTNLSDFFSRLANFVNKKAPLMPKEAVTWEGMLEDSFGTKGKGADWIIMRGMKPLNKSNSFAEYAEQFTAGLVNTSKIVDGKLVLNDRITTASMFGYGFFERLNAALNSMGMGLPTRDLQSGFSIMKGLVFKRIAPLAIAVESIKYMNDISSVILGEPFTKRFAEFYQDQSMVAANLRDTTGVTDWAKSWAGVFPGGEFISELPLIGHFFNLNKSADEQKKYWEEGSDPVRKGRYWDLGNTPFTGGQVEYYRPNWVRRAKAEVEYSDSMYGSREEYWENSWMPTLTHPFAPIKHFFTDPYWFERKHYEDRPYPVTGGIDVIGEFPLIGGILNDTIGQILKPQKTMHENWKEEQKQEDALRYGRHDVDSIIPAVVDPAAQQYFPSHRETSPILGVAAQASVGSISTANIGGLPAQPDGDTIAYTTSGGSIEVLKTAPGTDIRDLNRIIKDKGIQRSGDVSAVRLAAADPDVADTFAPKEDPMDPIGIQSALGNLHYNMAEIGGFYGFASNMMTGESFDDKPILASSNRATSYERAFWDQDFGGIGGEANEIFRRFLPHRRRQIEEINPIRNTMPSWLPGSNYYTDFQHGDPYIKVKHGEERLPGEGYERLYGLSNPATLSIGASYIGKSQEDIVSHLLKRDELDKDDAQDIMGYGERVHKHMQKMLTEKGIMIDYEQHVEDKVHAINGFYDGRVNNEKFIQWAQQNAGLFTGDYTGDSQAIIEMKTMSDKAFHSGEVRDYHRAQVNFYQGRTGIGQGYLIYLNRDNPDEAPHIYGYGFDRELYNKSLDNVKSARETVRRLQNNGVIGPADTYNMIDRLRILADVAPYSDEYRNLRDQIGKLNLDDDDKKRVQEIRHQVAERKKFTRMTPYKFQTASVHEETVTVTKVMPGRNYMFLTEEYKTNPIKLAGIEIPSAKDDPIAQEAHAAIAKYIKPGTKLKVLVNSDPLAKVNDDTYQTISAVIEAGPIKNLNHELLRRGLAVEKETDDSATGVYARYSPLQRTVGKLWEKIAHMDTILNTKWLQVRSPLESYERREVYGKDWQDWNTPIQSFVKPAIYTMAHKGVIVGALEGAVLGLLMGRTGYARIIGTTLGALLGASAGAYAKISKALDGGKEWVPEVRKKEWDVNEYIDTLTYVKDQKLFRKYAQLAKEKEHFDVLKYVEQNKAMGKKRKSERDELEKLKRELKFADNERKAGGIRTRIRQLTGYQGENGKEDKDLLRALNQKIYELANTRDIKKLGKYSAKALMYYQDSEKTMYGYEPGGPLENLLAALPKKDREYLLPFMEAPQQERKRILEETPIYMRRALEANWGLPVEEKEDLSTYFSHHELPNANWVGWDERASMDDVKVKIIKREAMDQSEFDIWGDDNKRADRVHIDTPQVYSQQVISKVRSTLQNILGKNGLHDIDVEIEKTNHGKIDIDVNVEKDRRREVLAQLNETGMAMFT